MTESALFHGYRSGRGATGVRVEPCACGLDVVCLEDDIPTGVASHNKMPEHQDWRARGGMQATVDGSLAPPGRRFGVPSTGRAA